jgi:hypothetical protein
LTIKLTRPTAASASIQQPVIPSEASISQSKIDAQSRDLLFCGSHKGHHTP